MTCRRALGRVIASLAGLLSGVVVGAAVQAPGVTTESTAQADATAAAARGRALYFGTEPFRAPARVAGAPLPGSASACAGCHGARGEGTREGPMAAPPLRVAASAHDAAGRGDDLLAAVVDGIGHDGRRLAATMPRYRLDADEREALRRYLPLLGTEGDAVTGVSAGQVTLAVLLAPQVDAAVAAGVLAGASAVVDEVNAQGGIHGRRLVLRRIDQVAQADGVFALVASLPARGGLPGGALAARRLPDLASLAIAGAGRVSDTDGTDEAWSIHLLPGIDRQVRAMKTALRQARTRAACEAWIADFGAAATADDIAVLPGDDAIDAAGRPRARPTCLGIVGGSAQQRDALFARLAQAGARVALLVDLADAAGACPADRPQQRLLVLPAPPAVAAQARRLDVPLWQVLGAAALRTSVEALARSGRLLQPEIVLASARALTGFAPVDDAPLDIGPTRRDGWDPVTWVDERCSQQPPRRPS